MQKTSGFGGASVLYRQATAKPEEDSAPLVTGCWLYGCAGMIVGSRNVDLFSPTGVVLFLAACSGVLQAQTPVVALSGPSQVRLGGTGQYSALVNGVPGAVVWSANGVAGGLGSLGRFRLRGFIHRRPLFLPVTRSLLAQRRFQNLLVRLLLALRSSIPCQRLLPVPSRRQRRALVLCSR